jgi:hypothetical protein
VIRGRVRKTVVGAALATGVLLASASPAFAHFCLKVDFNAIAASHAGGSNAWLTVEEYEDFLPFIEEECGPATAAAIQEVLDAADEHTLFMGPGLLAGGTLKNGKGNTPDHFAYMLEAFETCEE